MNRVNYSILFIFICVTIVSSQNKKPLIGIYIPDSIRCIISRHYENMYNEPHDPECLNYSNLVVFKYKKRKQDKFSDSCMYLARPSISHVETVSFIVFNKKIGVFDAVENIDVMINKYLDFSRTANMDLNNKIKYLKMLLDFYKEEYELQKSGVYGEYYEEKGK